jgi:hypothetical protein
VHGKNIDERQSSLELTMYTYLSRVRFPVVFFYGTLSDRIKPVHTEKEVMEDPEKHRSS